MVRFFFYRVDWTLQKQAVCLTGNPKATKFTSHFQVFRSSNSINFQLNMSRFADVFCLWRREQRDGKLYLERVNREFCVKLNYNKNNFICSGKRIKVLRVCSSFDCKYFFITQSDRLNRRSDPEPKLKNLTKF